MRMLIAVISYSIRPLNKEDEFTEALKEQIMVDIGEMDEVDIKILDIDAWKHFLEIRKDECISYKKIKEHLCAGCQDIVDDHVKKMKE